MFVIRVIDAIGLKKAVFVLSLFKVKFEAESDGEDVNTTIIVVNEELREGDMDLAMDAFMDEFEEVKTLVCPVCKARGEHACRHPVFDASISYE